MIDIKAILTTTVLPIDGAYKVRTLEDKERESVLLRLNGVAHYISHPDTKVIVEKLGATKAESNLFIGLAVGESALCLPIKQGLSDRTRNGFSSPHQAVEELGMLSVRLITRVE